MTFSICCGRWSGTAKSPTTHSRRCVRSEHPRRTATARNVELFAVHDFDRAVLRGCRDRKVAGVCCLNFADAVSTTERQVAIAGQLVERHGVLTKEMLAREEVAGGFAGLYPVLKAMEESGKVRRGYFVTGLGAAQFASPGADDRLRSCREEDDEATPIILAATDPANPWGNALTWPATPEASRPQRTAGARVIVSQWQAARLHQSQHEPRYNLRC